MSDNHYNVLFLCTGNSARSILAEALLNHWGAGRFSAFSAGSQPAGKVQPLAVALLEKMHIETRDPRSKSWDEFAGDDAPPIHFVFTVCGNAANETCPVWPGAPMSAHWGIDDPAGVQGNEAERMAAFRRAFDELESRIRKFTSLPLENLEPEQLKQRLDEIGNSGNRH